MNPPRADRPEIPQYGVPDTDDGLLPWSWVEERLAAATLYWVASVRPDGRPHAVPTWGAWVDGRCWFEGGLRTTRARNIAANPNIVVHVEHGDDVLMLEGMVRRVGPPDADLERRLVDGFAKYRASHGYRVDPANWSSPEGGLWAFQPAKALAWSRFPADATRWRFDA